MAVMDLFGLLVANGFGSIVGAAVFMMLLFVLYGGFMKMGIPLMTSICLLYFMIVLTGAYGGVIGVLIFFGTSLFFVTSLIPWVSGMMNK